MVGAMYTAPKRWSDDRLNQRVPLSIARWHKHINLCFPKKGTDPSTVDWKKFGMGTIATKAACDEAGGVFYPQLFGWMVHVYPWEKDPQTGLGALIDFAGRNGGSSRFRDSVRSMRW